MGKFNTQTSAEPPACSCELQFVVTVEVIQPCVLYAEVLLNQLSGFVIMGCEGAGGN